MSTEAHITRRQAVKAAAGAGAVYLIAPALPGAVGGVTALAASACATPTPELT
ncbi:MAG: hypothetical protein JO120_11595, partial [Solirubrobacterales bacterium]|nr:hypothetical protein [Solirubrobacterales bacterium]